MAERARPLTESEEQRVPLMWRLVSLEVGLASLLGLLASAAGHFGLHIAERSLLLAGVPLLAAAPITFGLLWQHSETGERGRLWGRIAVALLVVVFAISLLVDQILGEPDVARHALSLAIIFVLAVLLFILARRLSRFDR